MKINRSLLTNFNPDNDVTFYQNVTAESLSGTGTRMVVANSAGLLSTQAIPTSGVPTTRTLTINGTAYDLSADRTWNVGTVTTAAATTGGQVAFFNGASVITSVSGLYFDGVNKLGIANASPLYNLDVTGTARITSNLIVDTDTLYVDATKNAVGIGKAPISFYSDDRTIQLGYSACLVSSSSIAEDLRIANNVYFDSSAVPKRIAAGSAAIYSQFFNTHIFQSATSSTAGSTITWTDQMQILDDGTTLIATNSSSGNFKLQVNGNTFTNGEIKTAAPTGGTARNWRLGDALSDSGATADTKIEVEINGTTYYLMAYSSAL